MASINDYLAGAALRQTHLHFIQVCDIVINGERAERRRRARVALAAENTICYYRYLTIY